MSGHVDISAALLTRLFAVAPGAALASPVVKLENGASFTPPASGFWYRPFFLPGEPMPAAIGETAPNRHVGVFQIDVLGPAGKGTKATDDEAERIRACYARGTALTYSGVIVRIEKAWVARPSSQDDASYYKQIVRAQWWADIAN